MIKQITLNKVVSHKHLYNRPDTMQENNTPVYPTNNVMQKFWFSPERIPSWKSPNVNQISPRMFTQDRMFSGQYIPLKSRGGFASNSASFSKSASYFAPDNWRQRADDADDSLRRQD